MRGINSGNMTSAPMATVTAVTFIVAFAPVLCGLAQTNKHAVTGDCSASKKNKQEGKEVKEVKVEVPNTTLTLKCKEGDAGHVTPAFDTTKNFNVCTQDKCKDRQLLTSYIPGATVTNVSGVEATVQINDLPADEKTFYIQCGADESTACYIEVVVAKASSEPVVDENGRPALPGGVTGPTGGVTSGSPLSCATPGTSITIKIPEKGSTARFTCKDLTLYPLAKDRVFAEDCKKEESLKDVVRSDKDGDGVYTLTADKKPPKKKWCYLCARSSVTSTHPGHASDYCLVHVESSSRTQSSSAIALAAMLPCLLAMLRVT